MRQRRMLDYSGGYAGSPDYITPCGYGATAVSVGVSDNSAVHAEAEDWTPSVDTCEQEAGEDANEARIAGNVMSVLGELRAAAGPEQPYPMEAEVLPAGRWSVEVSHGHPDYARWYGRGRFSTRAEAEARLDEIESTPDGWNARVRIVDTDSESE